MDKRITLLVIMLLSLPIAQAIIISNEDRTPSLEYKDGGAYRMGIRLSLLPKTITIKGVGQPETFPSTSKIMIIADTYPHGEDVTPPAGMTLTHDCLGYETTLDLDTITTWGVYGYAWLNMGYQTDSTESVFSTNNEQDYISFSATCDFTLTGGYAYIITQTEIETDKSLDSFFTLPYTALEELTEKTTNLAFTLYEVFQIGLLTIGFFLFLFIPVFIYKTFKYFVKGNTRLWR